MVHLISFLSNRNFNIVIIIAHLSLLGATLQVRKMFAEWRMVYWHVRLVLLVFISVFWLIVWRIWLILHALFMLVWGLDWWSQACINILPKATFSGLLLRWLHRPTHRAMRLHAHITIPDSLVHVHGLEFSIDLWGLIIKITFVVRLYALLRHFVINLLAQRGDRQILTFKLHSLIHLSWIWLINRMHNAVFKDLSN